MFTMKVVNSYAGFLFQWENGPSPAGFDLLDLPQVCVPAVGEVLNTRAKSFTAPSKME